MKLTSYIKYFSLIVVVLFTATVVYASTNKNNQLLFRNAAIGVFDTIPKKKGPLPDDKKQKPDNSNKPDVKEVPKARPMPKPKVVGPKVKPVKIIRPKVGPKF